MISGLLFQSKRFILLSLAFLSFLKSYSLDSYGYDVKHYNISLEILPDEQAIRGKVDILLEIGDMRKTTLSFDLSPGLEVNSVYLDNKSVRFGRNGKEVSIEAPPFEYLEKNLHTVTIHYFGTPQIAQNAPWDGGFVWKEDKDGYHWAGVACQGEGASIWWPCKDSWADKPDSLDISLKVPKGYTCVSNGAYNGKYEASSTDTWMWKVTYPIPIYNVTFYLGMYDHLQDSMQLKDESWLDLDYYVLRGNDAKAAKHFEQVKTMLDIFNDWLGSYPFPDDGYKLIEAPYWGMEHQSAIAYGNNYRNNEFDFDFIIVHESAHEFWGNLITAPSPAELWIHEAFTTYSETLFLEGLAGPEKALEYLMGQREKIKNTESMYPGPKTKFHDHHTTDIYYKGAWFIHTLRRTLNNDNKFHLALTELLTNHAYRIVSTNDVLKEFSEVMDFNLTHVFNQYLNSKVIPTLEYSIKKKKGMYTIKYRWVNTIKEFDMPLWIQQDGEMTQLKPTTEWQKMTCTVLPRFMVNELLINVKCLGGVDK